MCKQPNLIDKKMYCMRGSRGGGGGRGSGKQPNLIEKNVLHARIQRRGGQGGQGVWTPILKNHKNIGFLSNIGPDPL